MTETSKKQVREYVQRFKRDAQTVINGFGESDGLETQEGFMQEAVNELLKLSMDIELIADETKMLLKVDEILSGTGLDEDKVIARILILIGLMPS
jgi:hypothetical protein